MSSNSMRTKHPPAFKAKVALEAYKEGKTSAELVSLYQGHRGPIRNWKALLVKSAPDIFNGNGHSDKEQTELIEMLCRKIGKLEIELDWLKKVRTYPIGRESSIPTRHRSLRAMTLHSSFTMNQSSSAWMGGEGAWTTSSPSGCGDH